MMSFRWWVNEKWYNHCDEVEFYTGSRPHYSPADYFNRYKWWLRREYRYQQEKL